MQKNIKIRQLINQQLEIFNLLICFPAVCVIILKVIHIRTVVLIMLLLWHIFMYAYVRHKYIKAGDLLDGGFVIETKVLNAKQIPKLLINGFDIYIQSTYFDNANNRQYFFKAKIRSQKKILDYSAIEKYLEELEYVNVLVNRDNYNKYMILLDEEIYYEKNNILNIFFVVIVWFVYFIFLVSFI